MAGDHQCCIKVSKIDSTIKRTVKIKSTFFFFYFIFKRAGKKADFPAMCNLPFGMELKKDGKK